MLSSSADAAFNVFVDALNWQATETIDWVYLNSDSTPTQTINYQTVDFNYKPGFRLGLGYEGKLDSNLYYTGYHTEARDSQTGNLTSAFLGATAVRPSNGYFYQSGQVAFIINYNMFDWDLGKRFKITPGFTLRPLVGIEGGWINQSVDTAFQGTVSVTENITNNFAGVGPKFGIETSYEIFSRCNGHLSLLANIATSYLWGHWTVKDFVYNTGTADDSFSVPSRNFGAVSVQGKVGANFDYKKLSVSLAYEMSDWFDQFQVMDDDTGTHNNDLTLQGLSLRLAYRFS